MGGMSCDAVSLVVNRWEPTSPSCRDLSTLGQCVVVMHACHFVVDNLFLAELWTCQTTSSPHCVKGSHADWQTLRSLVHLHFTRPYSWMFSSSFGKRSVK